MMRETREVPPGHSQDVHMRKFTGVAVAAVVLGLGVAGEAGAQVYGTRGAIMPGGGVPFQGYYSPYPGAMYSPFAPAPAVVGGFSTTGIYSPAGVVRAYYPPTVSHGFATYPTFGGYRTYSSYPGVGYGYRRW